MGVVRACKASGCTKSRQGSPYCRVHAETTHDVPRCDYPGCEYARLSGGVCQRHRAQLRRGIELKPIVDWRLMPCRFKLCDNLAAGRGRYCTPHASQKHRGYELRPLLAGKPCKRKDCDETSMTNIGMCKQHVNWNSYLIREYGITLAERDALADRQGHACAICGAPGGDELHVDHCHTSGGVRGLLCGPCNRAVGLMRDDPTRLISAARYLEGAPRAE